MNPYESELFDALQLFGGLLEDLNQRTLALENSLSPADHQRYEKELKRVRERGPSTNAAAALEVLQKKIGL
jgi:hypothetical protein